MRETIMTGALLLRGGRRRGQRREREREKTGRREIRNMRRLEGEKRRESGLVGSAELQGALYTGCLVIEPTRATELPAWRRGELLFLASHPGPILRARNRLGYRIVFVHSPQSQGSRFSPTISLYFLSYPPFLLETNAVVSRPVGHSEIWKLLGNLRIFHFAQRSRNFKNLTVKSRDLYGPSGMRERKEYYDLSRVQLETRKFRNFQKFDF